VISNVLDQTITFEISFDYNKENKKWLYICEDSLLFIYYL